MKKIIIIGSLAVISIIILSMTTNNIKTYVSMFINYTFYGSSKEALPQKLETEMDSSIAKVEKENIEKLIKKGYNVNKKNKYGLSPLHIAVYFSSKTAKEKIGLDIINILLKNGADVNIKDNEDKTPLFYSTNTKILRILLNNGANINACDNEGKTPLFYANNLQLIIFLLDNGADPNVKNSEGDAIIHNSSADTITSLLKHGANPNIQNKSGKTVLHDFYTLEDPKLVKVLLNYGARIDIKDNNGETPYSVAENYKGNKRKEIQESLGIMKRKKN